MAAREIGGYISTATGLGLECTGFSPPWVLLQTIIFTISTVLAVFDTYTDWEVVLNFQEVGFNHPLLPPDDNWLRAWFLFAAFGTVLSVISIGHEGIDILFSLYKSCQKRCCKNYRKAYRHVEQTTNTNVVDTAFNTRYTAMVTEITSDETQTTARQGATTLTASRDMDGRRKRSRQNY